MGPAALRILPAPRLSRQNKSEDMEEDAASSMDRRCTSYELRRYS